MSLENVRQFHRAHRAILLAVDDVSCLIRSFGRARMKIFVLNVKWKAHLDRQNAKFYFELKKFHRAARENTRMIDFLVHDAKEVKIKTLGFMEKYCVSFGTPDPRSFVKEYTEFARLIIDRLNIEEEYLMPLLKNMPDAKLPGEPDIIIDSEE